MRLEPLFPKGSPSSHESHLTTMIIFSFIFLVFSYIHLMHLFPGYFQTIIAINDISNKQLATKRTFHFNFVLAKQKVFTDKQKRTIASDLPAIFYPNKHKHICPNQTQPKGKSVPQPFICAGCILLSSTKYFKRTTDFHFTKFIV